MDQGASAKERLPPAFAHLPLRVRIVVVRAHLVAAGLKKPFTSLRHGRERSQKNNLSGAGGARNKRSSLATSGGGVFLGGRKKGVGATGRPPAPPAPARSHPARRFWQGHALAYVQLRYTADTREERRPVQQVSDGSRRLLAPVASRTAERRGYQPLRSARGRAARAVECHGRVESLD